LSQERRLAEAKSDPSPGFYVSVHSRELSLPLSPLFSALPSPPGSADSEGDYEDRKWKNESRKSRSAEGGKLGERSWFVDRVACPVKRGDRVGEVPPTRVFLTRSLESIESKRVAALARAKGFAKV
jgi:hypothetical protein